MQLGLTSYHEVAPYKSYIAFDGICRSQVATPKQARPGQSC